MSLVKGSITPVDPEGEPIFFEYNPSGFEVAKEAGWAEIGVPGLDFPLQQFVRGNLKTLSLEVYLNRDFYARAHDVRASVQALEDLVESTAQTGAPPICVFQWGRFDFVCVVGSVSVRYTMFDEAGDPLEATVSLALRRYAEKDVSFRPPRREVALPLPREVQRPAFEGWQKGSGSIFSPPEERTLTGAQALVEEGETRTHVTQEGDTFQSVATKHYGDPSLWRVIEFANRGRRMVDNLRAIRSGERFLVPDIENALGILEGTTNFPPEVRESLRFGRTRVTEAETLFRAVAR